MKTKLTDNCRKIAKDLTSATGVGLASSPVVGSQVESNSRDITSSSGPEFITSTLKEALKHQKPRAVDRRNSSGRPSLSGPELLPSTLKKAVIPQQQPKP